MKEKDWKKFSTITEEKFKSATIERYWGFQIQKNTKWNLGLGDDEIAQLEQHFGFPFPADYIEMLKVLNGFDTFQIAIDPDGEKEDKFDRRCYKYPDDLEKTEWLVNEVTQYIQHANEVLEEAGFDSNQVEGFIPLYGHRALVVLKNKQLSPVLSIWGEDIILYGQSLIEYWAHEFQIDFEV